MKIALIHYRLIYRGGLERRLIHYTSWLAEQGHEVHVVVAKSSGEVVLPPGVQVHVLSPGLVPKLWRQRYFDYRLGRFMQQHHFDVSLSLMRTSHQDVVLCPGNHLGYLKALRRTAKGWKDAEQIRADRLAFNSSRLVLAASGMMAREAIDLYAVPPEKVRILPPPVDHILFHEGLKTQQVALREAFGLPANKRLFLFVSSSHFRKGLPLLLRLFGQLTDSDVVLVIAGLPKVNHRLPNVIDLEFISNMEKLYASVDFTIHPALYEPYGQNILESVCCGTPVLLSDACGAADWVEPTEGLVLPLDREDLWLEVIRQADPKQFSIASRVAQRKQITVNDHMRSMMAAFENLKPL